MEELILTSKAGDGLDVESDRGDRTGVRRTDGWNDQPGSSPNGGRPDVVRAVLRMNNSLGGRDALGI